MGYTDIIKENIDLHVNTIIPLGLDAFYSYGEKTLENGNEIIQETRLYDPDKDETRPMRSKEETRPTDIGMRNNDDIIQDRSVK